MGNPIDLVYVWQGGTGATTALAAFNNLSPMVAQGDLIVGGVNGSALRLGLGTAGQVITTDGTNIFWGAGNTNTATGNVVVSGTPVLNQLAGWTNATTIQGITIGSGLSLSGTTLVATGSGGSVTSFSAGNLSPLFTTSVATATSTPALSFTLSNATANSVYGNNSSSSTAPSFQTSISVSGSIATATTLSVTGTSALTGNVGVGGSSAATVGLYVTSAYTGASGVGIQVTNSMTATGNSQNMYGIDLYQNTFNTVTYTGLSYQGINIASPVKTGTGTVLNSYQIYMAGGMTATNQWGIYQNATDPNYLGGNLIINGNVMALGSSSTFVGSYLYAGTGDTAQHVYIQNGVDKWQVGLAITESPYFEFYSDALAADVLAMNQTTGLASFNYGVIVVGNLQAGPTTVYGNITASYSSSSGAGFIIAPSSTAGNGTTLSFVNYNDSVYEPGTLSGTALAFYTGSSPTLAFTLNGSQQAIIAAMTTAGIVTNNSSGVLASLSNASAASSTLIGLLGSGSASSSTFLRGDGTWSSLPGGGNVSNTGTPVAGQVAVWTSAVAIAGYAGFTSDSSGNVVVNTLNQVTITAAASAVLTITAGKTLAATNTLTLSGTDSTTMTFPSTSATIARTDSAQTFTGTQTFSGVITSTVSTGTAPFTISSSSQVTNLNASYLIGATWASPGAIGTTSTNAGNFTSIGATSAGSGAFTTLSASSTISGAGFQAFLESPTAPIGSVSPVAGNFTSIGATSTGSGAFTTLTASSNVTGAGFQILLESPIAAIGSATPVAGTFTFLTANSGLTASTTSFTSTVKFSTTGASAPGTTAMYYGNISLGYGSGGNTVLSPPTGWLAIEDSGGTTRKVPYYT